MDRKGFLLINVLFGLFLLGIIGVVFLPIVTSGMDNLSLIKIKMDMIYTAESLIEEIKSLDYKSEGKQTTIIDMEVKDLLDLLASENEIFIAVPLNDNGSNHKFQCQLNKIENKNLWHISVRLMPTKEVKKIKDVEISALMPIPEK